MRPHRLTMKAFGPFAKETVVDFDAMGNSIYLICGDTGSGKTTIFDGIMYALYGTASGGARSALGTEAFHSDFAKSGSHREEMRVALTFSNAGRTYTVSRRMYWGKKGNAQRPVKESILSEKENVLLHGKGREDADDVTMKVKEILGLDADQFRRIIMLAQGEFQRFLAAKSEERGAILGKLYDNRAHQDLQFRLKGADAFLKKQAEDLARDAQVLVDGLIIPESDTGSEKISSERFSADHPGLLSMIEEVLTRIRSECGTLQSAVREQEERTRSLEARRAKAEMENGLLEKLRLNREKLSLLEEAQGQMEELRARVRLAEAAQKVLPADRALLQAELEWNNVLERIRNLDLEKEALAQSVGELEKSLRAIREKNAPLAAEYREQCSSVQNVLHFYEDLSSAVREQKKQEKRLKQAERTLEAARKDLEGKEERQKALTMRLEELSSAGELAVSTAKRALADLEARRDSLEEVRVGIRKVRELAEKEDIFAAAFQEAGKEELKAEEAHLHLNAALIRGQAGILAQNLRDRLKESDVVVCPVCGSSHTAQDIAAFARRTHEIPSQEAVDEAYAAWNEARERLGKAKEAYLAGKNAHARRKEEILRQSVALLGIADWETLTGGKTVELSAGAAAGKQALPADAALAECAQKLSKAREAYDRAKADAAEKEQVRAEKERNDAGVIQAKQAYDGAQQALGKAQLLAANAGTSVANWKAQLEGFPERKEDALGRIRELEERIGALNQQVEEAAAALTDCQKKQAKNAGSLQAAQEEKAVRAKALHQAKEQFEASLHQFFPDLEAYYGALHPDDPEGESAAALRPKDPEAVLFAIQSAARHLAAWIPEKKKELEKYDGDRQEAKTNVRQLEESTRDMVYTDLQAVTDQITEAKRSLEGIRAKERDLDTKLRQDEQILDRLRCLQRKREHAAAAISRLSPLSEAANGSFAFSRYVLNGFFHRIVEQANVHLDTMTDGEYQLVATQEGDRRSSLGLGLRILNTLTNLERETASLSGGQMFEASLSLALGLSDVVQMESTSTIRIDSMFIDEGFGSLDGERLDKALDVLQHLSGGKRQIGIISHVARLDECLPRKIHVIASQGGSFVRVEADV